AASPRDGGTTRAGTRNPRGTRASDPVTRARDAARAPGRSEPRAPRTRQGERADPGAVCPRPRHGARPAHAGKAPCSIGTHAGARPYRRACPALSPRRVRPGARGGRHRSAGPRAAGARRRSSRARLLGCPPALRPQRARTHDSARAHRFCGGRPLSRGGRLLSQACMRKLWLVWSLLWPLRAEAEERQRPALHWTRSEEAVSCIAGRELAERVEALTGPTLVRASEADFTIEG